MKHRSQARKRLRKEMTAAEVGRFLKQLSVTLKDSKFGNPALSEALWTISIVLSDEKYNHPSAATTKFMEQGGFDFDDDLDFSQATASQVREALANTSLLRAHLIILGIERFGIAKSRLERMSREEIVRAIMSALEHESSLNIISQEAQRGGSNRTS